MKLIFLLAVTLLSSRQTQADETTEGICLNMSPCGSDCYTTCDNTCKCDVTHAGQLPFPTFGGKCQETGFCESNFLNFEDCIEEGGPSCPNMVDLNKVMKTFTSYDFRIDVRSIEEWDEMHSNTSIHTPGLSKNPARNYLDKLEGKEFSKVLVYCKTGRRAFAASQNLLKYGFTNVHSFYHGGFPTIWEEVLERSEKGRYHPTKLYCYITGSSDICPAVVPRSHVSSSQDILGLGDNVKLIDVRPMEYKESLDDAIRVPNYYRGRIRKFLKSVNVDEDTLFLFCQDGIQAFKAAKLFRKLGWTGPLYYFDNGGYPQLKDLF